jgi:serine/threonine protein kinase
MYLPYYKAFDLFEYLDRNPNIPEVFKYEFCLQICTIIKHFHSMNLLHNDIKPENFCLDNTGKNIKLRLIDFETVSLKESKEYNKGTKNYICPFVYHEALPNSTYTDCFSLVITLIGILSNLLSNVYVKDLHSKSYIIEFYREQYTFIPSKMLFLLFKEILESDMEYRKQFDSNIWIDKVIQEFQKLLL